MPESFEQILNEVQDNWMDIEGVQAVGQGKNKGRDCIDVLVIENTPGIRNIIPQKYKGVPVIIRESGGTVDAY